MTTSPSLAGYLAAGPSSAALADATDVYVDRATGNLVFRLASGTVLQLTPSGQVLSSAGVDLAAAVANLLVNPGFEVLQRGAGPYTATSAYAHDRWQILLGGTSTVSVTDETTIVDTGSGHALKAAYVQGSAVSSIDQKVEDYLSLRGRTVTFAVRVRAGVAGSVRPYVEDSGARTYGAAIAATGSYQTLSATLAIGAGATAVRVGVELSASDTVYLDNATLAVGSGALPYAPLSPAEDLARCQRYYEAIGMAAVGGLYPTLGAVATAAAQRMFVPIPFAVGKAVAPTITKVGTWTVQNTSAQPAVQGSDRSGVAVYITAAAAGEFYSFPGIGNGLTAEANP